GRGRRHRVHRDRARARLPAGPRADRWLLVRIPADPGRPSGAPASVPGACRGAHRPRTGRPARRAAMKRFIHVGTGGWGRYWSRTVIPHLLELGIAEPAAAVDMNPANLANAREGYGIAEERCYTDPVRAFREQEADFAIVVVPPAHHEAIVDLALEAGCHILSEKPVADTMASSARIYLKVTRAGRKMAITMSHRFDQDKQTLERLVRSGAYGPVNYIVGRLGLNTRRFCDWGDFRHRIADPLLIEAAVHQFGIIRGLAGANARSVYATSWNPDWGEYAGDSTALAV